MLFLLALLLATPPDFSGAPRAIAIFVSNDSGTT
jgi:hypothetical protein